MYTHRDTFDRKYHRVSNFTQDSMNMWQKRLFLCTLCLVQVSKTFILVVYSVIYRCNFMFYFLFFLF
jgi:hypothetical protein